MAKSLKIDAFKFGIAAGIVSAICVFITTIGGIYGYVGMWTSLIVDIYGAFGYGISWLGAILGAVYGFIDAFIATWVFAVIYNKLAK